MSIKPTTSQIPLSGETSQKSVMSSKSRKHKLFMGILAGIGFVIATLFSVVLASIAFFRLRPLAPQPPRDYSSLGIGALSERGSERLGHRLLAKGG
ncbi:MAG: hypothetical protein HC806_04730 [Anaerolineae bacterium]|nr:hypothetical protein [Anaerolineae bacterium]